MPEDPQFSDRPGTTKSMRIALQDLALDQLYVVHPGEHTFALDTAITAIALPALIDLLRPQTVPPPSSSPENTVLQSPRKQLRTAA